MRKVKCPDVLNFLNRWKLKNGEHLVYECRIRNSCQIVSLELKQRGYKSLNDAKFKMSAAKSKMSKRFKFFQPLED